MENKTAPAPYDALRDLPELPPDELAKIPVFSLQPRLAPTAPRRFRFKRPPWWAFVAAAAGLSFIELLIMQLSGYARVLW